MVKRETLQKIKNKRGRDSRAEAKTPLIFRWSRKHSSLPLAPAPPRYLATPRFLTIKLQKNTLRRFTTTTPPLSSSEKNKLPPFSTRRPHRHSFAQSPASKPQEIPLNTPGLSFSHPPDNQESQPPKNRYSSQKPFFTNWSGLLTLLPNENRYEILPPTARLGLLRCLLPFLAAVFSVPPPPKRPFPPQPLPSPTLSKPFIPNHPQSKFLTT